MKEELISKCADRAVRMFPYCQKLDFIMYLSYCIEVGFDLDLEGLLYASDADFRHDIVGIANNLHPETKQLLNCFLPRFAR